MKSWFNRKKKYRITRLAAKLERLFQIVWGSKLWIVTYSFAIATAYYGSNMVRGYPEDLTADEQIRALKAQQGSEDSELVVSINEKIQDAMRSLQPVLVAVTEIRSLISGIQIVDGKVALTLNSEKAGVAYNQAHEARVKLIPVLAGIRSAHFQTTYFADFFKGYEQDFREVDSMLAVYENVFISAKQGNIADFQKAIENAASMSLKFQEATSSLNSRSSYMAKNTKHILEMIQIEGDKQERSDNILIARTLIFFSMLGLTFFLAVLAYKSQRKKKIYTPYIGGQPDLAKAQIEKYKAMRKR
jgi:hypothetical protein